MSEAPEVSPPSRVFNVGVAPEDLEVGQEVIIKVFYESGLAISYDGKITTILHYKERDYIAVKLNHTLLVVLKDGNLQGKLPRIVVTVLDFEASTL